MAPFDPRKMLSQPWVYTLLRDLTLRRANRHWFAEGYVRAQPGDRILDLGCGPADLLESFSEIEYVGVDSEARYIERARRRFGERGTFYCEPADSNLSEKLKLRDFDIVIAHGLVHHLDDDEARSFFDTARGMLRAGGRVVTMDGCFVAGQHPINRLLLRYDRGEFVRTRPEYEALARSAFAQVDSELRHDIFRVPYSVIILQCSTAGQS